MPISSVQQCLAVLLPHRGAGCLGVVAMAPKNGARKKSGTNGKNPKQPKVEMPPKPEYSDRLIEWNLAFDYGCISFSQSGEEIATSPKLPQVCPNEFISCLAKDHHYGSSSRRWREVPDKQVRNGGTCDTNIQPIDVATITMRDRSSIIHCSMSCAIVFCLFHCFEFNVRRLKDHSILVASHLSIGISSYGLAMVLLGSAGRLCNMVGLCVSKRRIVRN